MNAIEVKNLSKTFMIKSASTKSLKNTLINVFGGNNQKLTVLDNISFNIKKGEFIGVIGQNGCGKSTLLKILANIINPDSGEVTINGKISPFLELGVGFQEELSAKDNIYLYGALLDMTKSQISKKFDDIVSFSELEKFVNTPLKYFSSGMFVRLAFSVAIHADFDILLLDEVLAVGDYNFQQKCFQQFTDFAKQKKTIVYVSHDLNSVTRLCDKCIWLESGVVKDIGRSGSITERYMIDQSNRLISELIENINYEENVVSFKSISVINSENKAINSGDEIYIKIFFEVLKPISNPVIGINIHNKNQTCVYSLNTDYLQMKVGKLVKGKYEVVFQIKQYFAQGEYGISSAICDQTKTKTYFRKDKFYFFDVLNRKYSSTGVVDFPSKIIFKKNV